MWRSDKSRRYLWDAAAFVLFSALQPFCLNSSLISLLPSILVAAHIYSFPGDYPRAARLWFGAAFALSVLSMMTFYRPLQRLMLMWGIYFWIMLALGISIILAARVRSQTPTVPT
jgi:hypothetical protein